MGADVSKDPAISIFRTETISLKMEATGLAETLVHIYETIILVINQLNAQNLVL